MGGDLTLSPSHPLPLSAQAMAARLAQAVLVALVCTLSATGAPVAWNDGVATSKVVKTDFMIKVRELHDANRCVRIEPSNGGPEAFIFEPTALGASGSIEYKPCSSGGERVGGCHMSTWAVLPSLLTTFHFYVFSPGWFRSTGCSASPCASIVADCLAGSCVRPWGCTQDSLGLKRCFTLAKCSKS
jgi:hypothetical protein